MKELLPQAIGLEDPGAIERDLDACATSLSGFDNGITVALAG